MKKTIVALFVIANMMYFSSNALADQRFENWQGICHFAYDVNDDDNEVYFANCLNTIKTHDKNDGNGRQAYGSAYVEATHAVQWETNAKFDMYASKKTLKGADVTSSQYDSYQSAPDIPCIMVTSNYDAANDDNNETVYITNNWVLEIEWKDFDLATYTGTMKYSLNCKNGVAQ